MSQKNYKISSGLITSIVDKISSAKIDVFEDLIEKLLFSEKTSDIKEIDFKKIKVYLNNKDENIHLYYKRNEICKAYYFNDNFKNKKLKKSIEEAYIVSFLTWKEKIKNAKSKEEISLILQENKDDISIWLKDNKDEISTFMYILNKKKYMFTKKDEEIKKIIFDASIQDNSLYFKLFKYNKMDDFEKEEAIHIIESGLKYKYQFTDLSSLVESIHFKDEDIFLEYVLNIPERELQNIELSPIMSIFEQNFKADKYFLGNFNNNDILGELTYFIEYFAEKTDSKFSNLFIEEMKKKYPITEKTEEIFKFLVKEEYNKKDLEFLIENNYFNSKGIDFFASFNNLNFLKFIYLNQNETIKIDGAYIEYREIYKKILNESQFEIRNHNLFENKDFDQLPIGLKKDLIEILINGQVDFVDTNHIKKLSEVFSGDKRGFNSIFKRAYKINPELGGAHYKELQEFIPFLEELDKIIGLDKKNEGINNKDVNIIKFPKLDFSM